MTTLAHALPNRRLVSADLLKLRKRRGLTIITALLTIGSVLVTYAIVEGLHLANAAKHGVAGGTANLGNGATVVFLLGTVAAAIVGSVAGSGDNDAKVYRDLVVTGRSRLSLYLSRIPGGSHSCSRSRRSRTPSSRSRQWCSPDRPRRRPCTCSW